MASGLRVIPEIIRSVDSADFDGTFQTLGTGLNFACPLLKFVNNSNVFVEISWDGVNTHDVIPANSFALYDFSSDSGTTRGLYASQATQFWVNGAAAGTNEGLFYLVAFHTSEL